jgi:c-di-GMP-binding flagellar brake protein YcgR
MSDLKKVSERREHKRYFVKDRVFAVVRSKKHQLKQIKNMSKGEIALALLKSSPLKMGEIIEISRGGLSFSYIENEKKLAAISELDILFAEKDFHLSRLPFKAVEDTAVLDDGPFNALAMKRMTVQFENLSPQQKRKIEHFLSNYTTGEVTESYSQQAWGSG